MRGGLLVKNDTNEKIRYPKKITIKDTDPTTDLLVDTSSVLGTGKKAKISIA